MFEDWYLNDLFSSKIREIWKLTDYYLLKCIFNILDETKILNHLNEFKSIDEIIQINNYPKKVFSAIKWIFDRLTLDDYLIKERNSDIIKYKLSDKKMVYDLDKLENLAVQSAPSSIAAFNMLKLISDNYPKYLKGEKNGVDIIFSPDNIQITNEYYKNNLFYNVHNIAGAKILNWEIDNHNDPCVIVEIGGGLGGGTCEFIKQRQKSAQQLKPFKYYFTDIANKLLRSTKKDVESLSDERSNFEYKKMDFNKPIIDQGFEYNSVDIIWGVNAAHVANDLRFTLNEFYKSLKTGGAIILSETVRPVGNLMIQQELLLNTLDDYWNVKLDKDLRPVHGFMEWDNWINALKVIGFENVQTIPDMKYLQSKYDNCYVAVIRGIKG